MIKTVNNNLFCCQGTVPYDPLKNNKTINITLDYNENKEIFKIGQYYKIQLAFVS
jgi:hypothetical protein